MVLLAQINYLIEFRTVYICTKLVLIMKLRPLSQSRRSFVLAVFHVYFHPHSGEPVLNRGKTNLFLLDFPLKPGRHKSPCLFLPSRSKSNTQLCVLKFFKRPVKKVDGHK